MRLRGVMLAAAISAAAFVISNSAAAFGQRTALSMLDVLQQGRWELRIRDGGGVQGLCLADHRRLIQLRHPDQACDRLILEDTANSITVQYTCRGRGYGRTHIRRESAQLIQMETQGIADGVPFEFAAEGRRVGDCRF